jgi:hypothetical protein
MALIPIPLNQSYFPAKRDVSVYDLAFPVVQLTPDGLVKGLLGTCFPIANGLYCTAAHLFEPFSSINKELPRSHEGLEQLRLTVDELVIVDRMKCGVLTFGRQGQGSVTLVDRLTMCLSHDMALLFATNDLRGRNRPLLPIIESPGVGNEIAVIGYPATANDTRTAPDDSTQVIASLTMLEGRGQIIDAHPVQRDKTLAHYPCFETSASMSNGQSGGPVLDINRIAVIGVNSRSFGEDADYSVVSWLGKTLDMPFGFDDVEFRTDSGSIFPLTNTTLRKLAEVGIIRLI